MYGTPSSVSAMKKYASALMTSLAWAAPTTGGAAEGGTDEAGVSTDATAFVTGWTTVCSCAGGSPASGFTSASDNEFTSPLVSEFTSALVSEAASPFDVSDSDEVSGVCETTVSGSFDSWLVAAGLESPPVLSAITAAGAAWSSIEPPRAMGPVRPPDSC